ncbi:MAG: hypothetical protein GKS06_14395 [Acidobacteria bacterium]|nr:hypothetical protein [Acidobacteriota bacterium]
MTLKHAISLVALAAAGAVSLGPVRAQIERPYPAVPGYRPATISGDLNAVARTVATPDGRRVAARIGAAAPVVLGPDTPGDDGAPAMTRDAAGEVVVLASRDRGRSSELWLQRSTQSGWARSQRLRGLGNVNRHPRLATGARSTWAVWLHGDTENRTVHAAPVRAARLGAVHPLPRVGTEAGIPAVALDQHDEPVVVWSAFDGTDTEIWMSRRSSQGWSAPTPLSNNDVPDEYPSIGRDLDGNLIVSWSTFTPEGYLPVATRQNGSGDYGNATLLDDRPVGLTRVVDGSDGLVTWVGIRAQGYELRGATARVGGGWSGPTSAGSIESARVRMSASGRRLFAAIGDRDVDGIVESADGASLRFEFGLVPTPVPARNASSLPLTGTYRGFGDSITEGIIRFDGVITFSDGYPAPLAEFLAAFLAKPKLVVENAGVGGENTAEGLGRLAQLNATTPKEVTLIMEGINDATDSIAAATVVANLRAMVRSSRGANRFAVISTITPRTSNNFNGGSNPRIRSYNDGIIPMARAEGALLVDQYAAFLKNAHYYSDLLHPNEQGYEFMAVTWFRGLLPLLNELLINDDNAAAAARKADAASQRADRPIQ